MDMLKSLRRVLAGNSRNGRQYFKWSELASRLKVDMDMLKSEHCFLLATPGTVVSISSGQCWPLDERKLSRCALLVLWEWVCYCVQWLW